MIDYNDLVRGTMSDIRDPIQSVLDPNSEGFRVFDEFVIDSSVELIVNHRDIFLTRREPQEINKILWNRSSEARLGIQPFWQRLIQKMRDFGVMEEFSEKEADLIQWVTSEERRNHLERYSWTEGLRAYLIQGFTNWDFGAEHSDEVLALLTELADAEDRQKRKILMANLLVKMTLSLVSMMGGVKSGNKRPESFFWRGKMKLMVLYMRCCTRKESMQS